MTEQQEGLDNTNMVASIVETGDLHEVAMILGSRERIRHAGIIRPGIKIPLAGCNQQQKDLYTRLLDEGHGFEFIDAEMLKLAAKDYGKKTCLRPCNSDYFTIRDEDFKRPADAEYIRSHYADVDGKVRRIPCWLPTSSIQAVMPHNFRAFSAGGLRCVSFYEDGRLKFRYLPKDFKGAPKTEDWQVLDSDDEDEASKVCGVKVAFGGMYRVYVPGTRGAGEIVCPTQSWYGLGESVGVLKRVRSILGRFDGLFEGNAFFELCKVPEMIKTPDGKKQQQWIVTLELAVDPMELARYAEKLHERGPLAISALNGGQQKTSIFDTVTAQSAPAAQVLATEIEPEQSALQIEMTDRRKKCLAYLGTVAKLLALPEKTILDFTAISNFGSAVEDLDDDALAKFCENLRQTLKSKDPEMVKADIEAVVNQ